MFILKFYKFQTVLRKTSAANGYNLEVQKREQYDYNVITDK
jgi:hypothetical protein